MSSSLRIPALCLCVALAASCGGDEQPGGERTADASAQPEGAVDASAPDARVSTGMGSPPDGATPPFDAASGLTYDPRDPIVPLATESPDAYPSEAFPSDAKGDQLISRTGRGCLGVSGELVADAPIALETCRGDASQRWLIDQAGLRPEQATTLCVDASGGKVKLTSCPAAGARFVLGDDGVVTRATTALDVTSTGELISYGKHGSNNQQWSRLSDDLSFLAANASKTVSYPFPATDALAYRIEEAKHRVGIVQPPYPLRFPRDVSSFPGDVASSAPMISRRVFFNRRFDHDNGYLRTSAPPRNWQATGVYAPAGKTLIVVLPADAGPRLSLIINTHTDALTPDSSNVMGESFERMPRVSLQVALAPGVNTVRSPYGGDVVLVSDIDDGQVVQVDLHGGVEMPRFVLGVTSAEEWLRRRTLAVPWAQLEGDRVVLTVPSTQIQTLDRPADVMARYDRVAQLLGDLSGLDETATSGVHRWYDGKARYVSDVQITAGSGHSGYPIMTYNDWKLADQTSGGDEWGIWHELGHNHQQSCLWASRFGGESTVNLFSLYVQDTVHQESRIADQYDAVIAALKTSSLTFEAADVWQKLVFLMQPVHAFPSRGWDLYRQLHRAYRELPEAERAAICASTTAQVDSFYRLLSGQAGADLSDHFARWGLSPAQAARDSVAAAGLKPPSVVVWQAKD